MIETFVNVMVVATNAARTLPTSTAAVATIGGLATGGLIPFGGSTLVGYIIGFVLKKIVKWVLIILGVLAGIIFVVIQWMSQNGYVQNVRWDKLGNDMSSYGQHLIATQIDTTKVIRRYDHASDIVSGLVNFRIMRTTVTLTEQDYTGSS
jgi:uncharacterized membrane protein (Fun14 family)